LVAERHLGLPALEPPVGNGGSTRVLRRGIPLPQLAEQVQPNIPNVVAKTSPHSHFPGKFAVHASPDGRLRTK
jgi:hypothetical protein